MTTIFWNGTINADAGNAGNWTPNFLPTAGTIAVDATVTTGSVSEPFGVNSESFPVVGPVFTAETISGLTLDLAGGPVNGGSSPAVNFVPFDTDIAQTLTTGVTIDETGQRGIVNFLVAAVSPVSVTVDGVILSDHGGDLLLNAQGYELTQGQVTFAGLVAASNGGTVDIAPPLPTVTATDTNGNTGQMGYDVIENTGQILAGPGGDVILDSAPVALVNPGSIVAAGGTVFVNDSVEEANSLLASSGNGSLYIDNGVVDIVSPTANVAEFVDFTGAGTLIVANTLGQSAGISGVLGFAPGDTIALPGDTIAGLQYSGSTLSFQRTTGGQTFSDSLVIHTSVANPHFTAEGDALTLACYARGTRVQTTAGMVPVEALTPGLKIVTPAGTERPISWIGHRRVDCRRHKRPRDVWPVRIAAGAFARSLPARDLLLSPDHAVFAEGVLIPVRHLINGATIVQEPVEAIEYWHVELDSHDILLAEGLPAESYLDTRNRSAFANGGIAMQLHPDFAPGEEAHLFWEAAGCAPLRIDGAEVARVRARLARRARRLGHDVAVPKPVDCAAQGVTDLAALLQPAWYRATHADVAMAGVDPRVHYAAHGRAEGRLPCSAADLLRGLGMVDPAMLPFGLGDLVEAGLDVAAHYVEAGWREQRRINPYFDAAWYCARTDVPDGVIPLLHYLLIGEAQGRAPGPHFDPAWYRATYAIAPTHSPLAHYLAHRRTWRVSPNRTFDLAGYVASQAGRLLPDREPFAHFRAGLAAAARHAAAERDAA